MNILRIVDTGHRGECHALEQFGTESMALFHEIFRGFSLPSQLFFCMKPAEGKSFRAQGSGFRGQRSEFSGQSS
jgi:hypothetical protein